MKKVIFSFAILTSVIALSSCKKCQTCNVRTTQSYAGFGGDINVSEEYCGDEYDNAPAEGIVTQNAGGVNQEVEITCTDN